MAHSDVLIFLTNITWTFFLFVFTYFFFVLYFLPTFYKKFRARVLIRDLNFRVVLVAVKDYLAYKSLVYVLIRNTALNFCSIFLNIVGVAPTYNVFLFNKFADLLESKFLIIDAESSQLYFFPKVHKIGHLSGDHAVAVEKMCETRNVFTFTSIF